MYYVQWNSGDGLVLPREKYSQLKWYLAIFHCGFGFIYYIYNTKVYEEGTRVLFPFYFTFFVCFFFLLFYISAPLFSSIKKAGYVQHPSFIYVAARSLSWCSLSKYCLSNEYFLRCHLDRMLFFLYKYLYNITLLKLLF